MGIGEIIKKKREDLGMKTKELADKVGVHATYITQVENHGKIPTIEKFVELITSLYDHHSEKDYEEANRLYEEYRAVRFPKLKTLEVLYVVHFAMPHHRHQNVLYEKELAEKMRKRMQQQLKDLKEATDRERKKK